MVMEYVEGTNLDDLLKRHKILPPEFIVPVFVQALEGLQHAHRKNIFHRDIKPSNLMLTPDGTVKLMDFGIAKVAGEQKMTQVNKIVGTVEFMAPELLQGKDASAASDIYATGVTLYEMISGKLPFESDTDFNLMQAILKQKIKPPDKLNASVPKALNDIIMKALEKNPDNRYPDARAFQQALIVAFPRFKEINLDILRAAPVQLAQTVSLTQPNKDLLTAEALKTRAEIWKKPGTILETAKENILKNKKTYFLAAAVLIFLLFLMGIVLENRDTQKPRADNSSINKDNKNVTGDNTNIPTGTIVPQNPVNEPPAEKNTPVNKPAPDIIKPVNEKPKEKKPDINNEPVQKPVEKKEEELIAPIEKKEEKKDIYISSKVEVELYLRENLDDSPERKDIPVTFSVSSRVMYSGVTIIQQGAIANGTIKLGKVQTDIDINTITAANGQQIKLKALRGHGKRNSISSDRSYTAIIQPGQRLNF